MNRIISSILIILSVTTIQRPCHQVTHGFSVSSFSRFHGERLVLSKHDANCIRRSSSSNVEITMRKQKASDRRTTRRQRGGGELTQERIKENLSQREVTITSSPMTKKGEWKLRRQGDTMDPQTKTGGRGRSKKRSLHYNSLSLYHNKFFNFLTAEYKAEASVVTVRKNLPWNLRL